MLYVYYGKFNPKIVKIASTIPEQESVFHGPS